MPSSPEPTLPSQADSDPVVLEEAIEATGENLSVPGFGWTQYAERINGRFAMVGFIALLVLELWTGKGFFHWLGFYS